MLAAMSYSAGQEVASDTITEFGDESIHRSAAFGKSHTIVQPEADNPQAVHAADMDGDGDLDILSASLHDEKLAWYENVGGGNFGPQQIVSNNTSKSHAVFAADLDGDGDLDVLSTIDSVNDIVWYANVGGPGAPEFGPEQGITNSAIEPTDVRAADLDGDGDMDVVSAANFGANVAWYENDGTGNFGTQQVITSDATGAKSVFTADLDGDGDLDVLSASSFDDKIAWYENQGGGTFGSQQVIAADTNGARSVHAADLDGDGDLDVIGSASSDGQVAWYENQGGGTFGDAQPIASGRQVLSVYAADMDNDGDNDVAAANLTDRSIEWYENDGDGVFLVEHTITDRARGALAVLAADLDGDGDQDVVSASDSDDKVAWYRNEGSGAFGPQQVLVVTASTVEAVYSSDLDGDGDLDVLSASYFDNKVAWYANDGSGVFGPQQVITIEASGNNVHAEDLDGDGDMDVVASMRTVDNLVWYENNGLGGFGGGHEVPTTGNGATSVTAADLDSDGDHDLLAAFQHDGLIAWYENDGPGPPGFGTEVVITTGATGVQPVHATDLDSDGDMDVLFASAFLDKIAWFENDGNPGTPGFGAELVIGNDAEHAEWVVAKDLDGDGDLDVLAALGSNISIFGKIVWYENTGGPGAAAFGDQKVITDDALGAESVDAADLDNDGDLDVLSASRFDDKVAWYENDGQGVFGPQQIISDEDPFPRAVFAADLNGDGHTDVLAAAGLGTADRIAWFENTGGQFALPTTDTSAGVIVQGRADDVLRIDALHRGRAGDHDAQLVSLELLLEESPGDPLSSSEANALVESLSIYRDAGNGQFEPGSDTLVHTTDTLTLDAGQLTVPFTDGDPNVQFGFGSPATLFVVVELAGDATAQPVNQLRVTHVTESSSMAEDREAHVLLEMEFATNVSSAIVEAGVLGDMDRDGDVDTDDVNDFVMALVNPEQYEVLFDVPVHALGDIDGDGDLDLDDVDPFVTMLVGGSGQASRGARTALVRSESVDEPSSAFSGPQIDRLEMAPSVTGSHDVLFGARTTPVGPTISMPPGWFGVEHEMSINEDAYHVGEAFQPSRVPEGGSVPVSTGSAGSGNVQRGGSARPSGDALQRYAARDWVFATSTELSTVWEAPFVERVVELSLEAKAGRPMCRMLKRP